jgi:DNA primase
MGLFPQSFIEDLRMHADIVQVVQERVPLKRSGATYKGLCPFHSEKTPSFHVNPDKGFFHCFGCGLGGDVFKFVELHDKVGFPDAVRQLAARFGLAVPEPEDAHRDASADREREALLKIHELAAAWFREQLAAAAGMRARQMLLKRGLTQQTIEQLGMGYAPAQREALKSHLLKQDFELPVLLRSGLVVQRQDGTVVDRFRTRLIIPIQRETGPVVAFGGRAMEEGQQPKYLNSPETPIYTKGRTLYGLHATKGAIRRLGHAVLVEGYFDFAQAVQAGINPVVASSGTALTPAQARLLRRFTSKVILSFDPDAAGQGAAARSSELLVAEGFQVNVAVLPAGEDPDTVIRRQGGQAYAEKLRTSRPYLEYLLDREAAGCDLSTDEGRRGFLSRMLAVAARIPDAAARDQFADRLAHKARITEEVVRAEIRKAAVRRSGMDEAVRLPALLGQVTQAEKGLLWALWHQTDAALAVLQGLDPGDLQGLASSAILGEARALAETPGGALPDTLIERLNRGEADLLLDVARQPGAPAPPGECVRALRRRRYERERAEVQREIDRLQELGAARHDHEIDVLWARKKDLLQRLDALNT